MGWAGKHLSRDQREAVARDLFEVREQRGDWLHGLCPLHQDSMPSFGYNVAEDVWTCQAEHLSGDLIKLFSLINGLDDSAGFAEFRRRYDPRWVDARKRGGELRRERAQEQRVRTPYVPPENRIIPETVWNDITAPLPPQFVRRLEQERGWSGAELERLGVRLQVKRFDKKNGRVVPLRSYERVCLPVRDERGALRQIRLYKPFDRRERDVKIFSWGTGSGHPELFPSPGLWASGSPLLLVEGEPDALCGISRGFNAVGQTGKPCAWPEHFTRHFEGRHVVIVPDCDEPGMRYAEIAAKHLHGVAAMVRVLQWPDWMGRGADGQWPRKHGQDLTDWFVRHGRSAEELRELIADAPTYEPEPEPEQQDAAGQDAMREMGDAARFFTMGVNGRLSFKERRLADTLLDVCGPLVYESATGTFYKWNGQHFDHWEEELMHRQATLLLGEEAQASRVAASCKLARSLSVIEHGRAMDDCTEWVCIRNGMLNLATGDVEPHAPDFLASHMLPVTMGSDQEPVRWLRFLRETIQTDGAIAQLQEFMGYSLTRDVRYEKALLLFGPGGDGKSKLCNVWMAMLGEKNCSSVPLAGLDDQFQRVGIHGKLLNLATEIDAEAVKSAMFKAIVSGDPIQAAYKHQNVFSFAPYVKLVYACNELPRILDNSDGLFRRLLPITFKRQFRDGDPDKDVDLQSKLLGELDAIFEWAFMGLQRLRAQGGFTECEETQDFLRRMRRYNSPLTAFAEDECEVVEDAQVKTADLYAAFKTYASRNGYRSMSKGRFEQDFPQAFAKVRDYQIKKQRVRTGPAVTPDSPRPFVFNGMRLKNTPQDGL